MNLSTRTELLEPSPTLAIKEQATRLNRSGRNVIDLSAGDPDFDTPAVIKESARKALADGFTHYTAATGIDELKEAIVNKYSQEYGLEYDVEQVIVSVGAKHSLYNAMVVLLDEGDQVLLPAPYWVSYPPQIELAGGEAKVVSTEAKEGFTPTATAVEEALTERTKALILNSPNNPTGCMIGEDELKRIASLACREDLFLISDECYEKMTFGEPHRTAAKFVPDRTLIVNSFSKTYAMTGWRLGYALGPKEIVSAMGRLQSQSTSNPCSIAQRAGIAALENGEERTREMVDEFRRRKEVLSQGIERIPGLNYVEPGAAFYLWVDVRSHLGERMNSSEEFCASLLEEEALATVPGSAFGMEGFIRLSYGTESERLEEVAKRLGDFCRVK